jgi:hypothetical protein
MTNLGGGKLIDQALKQRLPAQAEQERKFFSDGLFTRNDQRRVTHAFPPEKSDIRRS